MMMEEALSIRQKYREIVSKLMTPGAIGMAVLLGSAAPVAASQEPAGQQPSSAQGERVSERLAAIREAVSAVGGAQASTTDAAGEQRLAWGNWGGGFGFGLPWGNFGAGGPWNNWNNWRNGWHNWHNGWGNW
jgi:rSAM-associated Gly-rich repeat protein